eukprot:Skav236369  [mRNA]  locus=scaffold1770:278242:281921:+ [translate_table: standard]
MLWREMDSARPRLPPLWCHDGKELSIYGSQLPVPAVTSPTAAQFAHDIEDVLLRCGLQSLPRLCGCCFRGSQSEGLQTWPLWAA